jgi:RimJ/RimL family protein N-acetyltransferase
MLLTDDTLELRALEPEDDGAVMAILEHPAVVGSLFSFPAKAATMGFELWRRASILRRNDFYFAVTERATRKTVGICAYQDIDYRNGRATLWAALSPEFEEDEKVIKLLAQTAFDHLRLEHLALLCLSGDVRTIAVASKAGFKRDSIFYSRVKKNDKRYDLLIYTLLKGEGGDML